MLFEIKNLEGILKSLRYSGREYYHLEDRSIENIHSRKKERGKLQKKRRKNICTTVKVKHTLKWGQRTREKQ
jgi:hypothetical protein